MEMNEILQWVIIVLLFICQIIDTIYISHLNKKLSGRERISFDEWKSKNKSK